MNHTILCINGSDSTGQSGIQADIKTARDMGGYAVTAVTSVTVQNHDKIAQVHELPAELVVGQVKAVYDDLRPKAVKVGMINNADAIRSISDIIVGGRRVVCSPGILSSHGGCLMSSESLAAFRSHLLPICTLLILKCTDAEILLGRQINNDADMTDAARTLCDMGAEWVLLRGGTHTEGRINALLYGNGFTRFFSSINIDGWRRHGVGGALSTAIAVRLAAGDDVPDAIRTAHEYIHNQVVYQRVKGLEGQTPLTQPRINETCPSDPDPRPRLGELYNTFLSLVADNYCTAHDVQFYADRMAITPRYLSQITNAVAGKSPKQIIDSHLIDEIDRRLIATSANIQELSLTFGFSSQVMFAKFFKSKHGISPTRFRDSSKL